MYSETKNQHMKTHKKHLYMEKKVDNTFTKENLTLVNSENLEKLNIIYIILYIKTEVTTLIHV